MDHRSHGPQCPAPTGAGLQKTFSASTVPEVAQCGATSGDAASRITVSIARRVRPGKERDYERWVHHVVSKAATFPGHLGVAVLRPPPGAGGEYILIDHFETPAKQRAWENSAERAQLLRQLKGITEGHERISKGSGVEFWLPFSGPLTRHTPNRHRMAVVVSAVVFALAMLLNLLFGRYIQQIPIVPRLAILSVAQVTLLTYALMPRITALLRNWLYNDIATDDLGGRQAP